jgi:hypothetical protein
MRHINFRESADDKGILGALDSERNERTQDSVLTKQRQGAKSAKVRQKSL